MLAKGGCRNALDAQTSQVMRSWKEERAEGAERDPHFFSSCKTCRGLFTGI